MFVLVKKGRGLTKEKVYTILKNYTKNVPINDILSQDLFSDKSEKLLYSCFDELIKSSQLLLNSSKTEKQYNDYRIVTDYTNLKWKLQKFLVERFRKEVKK